jgi:hypothetical protein
VAIAIDVLHSRQADFALSNHSFHSSMVVKAEDQLDCFRDSVLLGRPVATR